MDNENADSSEDRVHEILRSLEIDLIFGWAACQAAKHYSHAIQSDTRMSHTWMHWISFVACQRESVMALARLTDHQPQSVSLPTLLRYSDQNTQEYKRATPKEVRLQICKDTKWLREHKTFDKVRALRDRVLAHTDKKKFCQPGHMMPFDVEIDETEKTFEAIHTITDKYRWLYDNSMFELSNISEDIETEMQYELTLKKPRQRQSNRQTAQD